MKLDYHLKAYVLLIGNLLAMWWIFNNSARSTKQFSTNHDEFTYLNELLNCSDEQLLVNKSILMKTVSFMIQDTEELDPKLIAFVRSIINVPPVKEKKLNLSQKQRTDFSQFGQSKFIDQMLNSKRNGFFVEAGGFDGEIFSV